MSKSTSALVKILVGFTAFGLLATSASAATSFHWNTVTGAKNWSSPAANWLGSAVPDNSQGSLVYFDSALTASQTVTLDVPATLGTLELLNANATGAAFVTTLATSGVGSTNTLTFDSNGADNYLYWNVKNPATTGIGPTVTAPIYLCGNLNIINAGNVYTTGTPSSRMIMTINSAGPNASGNFNTITVNGGGGLILTALGTAAGNITNLAGLVNNAVWANGATGFSVNPPVALNGNVTLATGSFTLAERLGTEGTLQGGTVNVANGDYNADVRGYYNFSANGTYNKNLPGIQCSGNLNVTGAGNQPLSNVGGIFGAQANTAYRSTMTMNTVGLANVIGPGNTGNTNITGAFLNLAYNTSLTGNSMIGTGTLNLNSGSFQVTGNTTGTTSVPVNNTILTGLNEIYVNNPGGSTSTNLNLGTITQNATYPGGMAIFTQGNATAGTCNFITSTANIAGTSGLLGGWAYMSTAASIGVTSFAGTTNTGSGGNITLPTYATLAAGNTGNINVNWNIVVNGQITLTTAVTGASLRILSGTAAVGPTTLNLNNNNLTLSSGGLLFTQASGITNGGNAGQILGPGVIYGDAGSTGNSPLYVFVNNQRLTTNATLVSAAATSGALVVGGQGSLVVTTPAVYTGGTYVNGADLRLPATNTTNWISGGPLVLSSSGELATAGSITMPISATPAAGSVTFGPGGGGFSAETGILTVNLGGAGATINASQMNRNLALNNDVYSLNPVYFTNNITLDAAGGADGLTVSTGAILGFAGTAGHQMYSNYGTAPSEITGNINGIGNLQVFGNGGSAVSLGMLAVKGGLNYVGNTILMGGSLYVPNQSALTNTNGNLEMLAGGVLATHGTFNMINGTDAGQFQFPAGGTDYGGFAAVGGPLNVLVSNNATWNLSFMGLNGMILGSPFSTHGVNFQNPMDQSNPINPWGPVMNQISGPILTSTGNIQVGGPAGSGSSNGCTGCLAFTATSGGNASGNLNVASGLVQITPNSQLFFGTTHLQNINYGEFYDGTVDLNGQTVAGIQWFFDAGGNGPLALPQMVNLNTAQTAVWGDSTNSSNLALRDGGNGNPSSFIGGPGNIIINSNFAPFTGIRGSGVCTINKVGTGSLTITGNWSNTLFTPLTTEQVNTAFVGGTVTLDYSTNASLKLPYASGGSAAQPTVTFTQTNLVLNGSASTAVTQTTPSGSTTAGITLGAGASTVQLIGNGAALTFSMGNFTISANSAVDFSTVNNGSAPVLSVTGMANNNNNLMGAWATYNQYDWARIDTNNTVVPLDAGNYTFQSNVASWAANKNITNNSASGAYDGSTVPAALTIASLRFHDLGGTVTIGTGQTLKIGDSGATVPGAVGQTYAGVLVTPTMASDAAITGGTLAGPTTNAPIYFHQNSLTNNLTIASVINAGNQPVSKDGGGTLILTGANTFTGNLNIYGGTVQVNSVAAVGSAQPLGKSSGMFLQGGSTLRFLLGAGVSTSTQIYNVDIGGGTLDASSAANDPTTELRLAGTAGTRINTSLFSLAVFGADGSLPNLTLTGNATGNVTGTIDLFNNVAEASQGGAGAPQQSGVIPGVTQVTKTGSGTWELNNNNFWQGGTVINQGKLVLGNSIQYATLPMSMGFQPLSPNGPVTLNGGTLDLWNNTITVGQTNIQGGTLDASAGPGTLYGRWYTATGGTVTANVTLAGDFAGLDVNGPGLLTLAGANTYGQTTTLNAGTLALGSDNSISTGNLVINGGAIQGSDAGLRTLSNNMTWNGDFTISGSQDITFSPATSIAMNATRTVTVTNSGNTVIASPIAGSGFGLIKSGAQPMTLTANNTYSGPTTVSQGILRVASTGLINNSTSVTVNPTGTFDYQAANQQPSPPITNNAGGTVLIASNSTVRVAGGTGYNGYQSSIVGDLGTSLDLLDGTASVTSNLTPIWRVRSASEGTVTTPGSHPPLPGPITNLISDVVTLTNTAGGGADVFTLQMSYSPSEIQGGVSEAILATQGLLYLAYCDPSSSANYYQNAGDPLNGYVGNRPYNPGIAGDFLPGNWGVDTANHVVWAVLGYNGTSTYNPSGMQYAVVPEPGSLALLTFGSLAVLRLGRKKNK